MIVAWLSPGTVEHDFCRSLTNTIQAEPERIVGQIPLKSGPNLSAPRNQIARTFLANTAEWLWMVDSDMTFPPDTLARLLDAADPVDAPIVGGLCFGQRGPDEIFPTMFVREDGESYRVDEYPPDTLLDVAATGTGCLLVHRDVLEKLQANYREPFPWFAETVNEHGGVESEDVTFCFRARDQGFPVKVHTGIPVGHVKPQVINEAVYQAWRKHGE